MQGKSENPGRNLTLESLLDTPAPKDNALNGLSKRKIPETEKYIIHPVSYNKRPRLPVSRAKDACLEIIAVLLQQDINGFFHFAPKRGKNDKALTNLSLRALERYIHTYKVDNLAHLRKYLDELFDFYKSLSPPSSADPDEGVSVVVSEAFRLSDICKRWFDSIGENPDLMLEPLYSVSSTENSDKVTALGLLNPDNHGIVSATERVRPLGEEVGPLACGTHLSQFGGYREDRRNRVIPYTYLNYGPYASFGPSFDSGASNCSPEANQLLLSTSWLPARMLYALESRYLENDREDEVNSAMEETGEICPWSRLRVVPEAEGDEELQWALAECETEWKAAHDEANILEEIIPSVVCSDRSEGDFGLYLANAITRNLPPLSEEEDADKFEKVVKRDGSVEALGPSPNSNVQNLNAEERSSKLGNDEKNGDCTKGGKEEPSEEDQTEVLLARSGSLLGQLYRAQYRRLGDFSPSSLAEERSLRPDPCEIRTATRLASHLVTLVGKMTRGPGDIMTSRAPVRQALGLDPKLEAVHDDESRELKSTQLPSL